MMQELFPYVSLAFGLLMVLSVLQFVFVVYRDAIVRDVSGIPPVYWSIGVAFFPVPFHPLYAYFAVREGRRDDPLSRRDRWGTWLYGTVVGAALIEVLVSPPEPITQSAIQFVLLVPAGVILYLLVFAGGTDVLIRCFGDC